MLRRCHHDTQSNLEGRSNNSGGPVKPPNRIKQAGTSKERKWFFKETSKVFETNNKPHSGKLAVQVCIVSARINTKMNKQTGRRKKEREREEESERRERKEVEVAETPTMAIGGPWGPPWLHIIHERKMIRERRGKGKKWREGGREAAKWRKHRL